MKDETNKIISRGAIRLCDSLSVSVNNFVILELESPKLLSIFFPLVTVERLFPNGMVTSTVNFCVF